ncbi:ATP-binding protein [Solirubrum puertoriconensis]|uniref:Sensory/regulatory protein RpfC n=1 Tax=Solirubrum puertoriconensis TaxID=1751427 RepID=A0A9X0L5C2_SOLP1|nr:ATP-binding protein [Solirubrum puertoriconensis]KUG08507.1 hypothetical protein ASU33_10115 [Solirubrum puertoriconensis]
MTEPTFSTNVLPATLADAHARIQELNAKLAAQESLLRIPARNPNPVFRLHSNGQVIYTNQAGEELRRQQGSELEQQLRTQALAWAHEALATNAVRRQYLSIGEQHFKVCVTPEPSEQTATLYLTEVTELRQARLAAEAAAASRANFLANMSHEIRTPLNGVLGIANQLSKTPLNARQQELLGIIRSSGQHLLTVINDVLDMTKINAGMLELVQEPFDVCEVLYRAAEPLLMQAEEKGITVVATRLHDSCPNPQVLGDSHRLSQVILNLLSNAIKFTPAGGRIDAGGYQIAETDDTLTVEFRFSDTGVGIAPDKIDRIFESFTQAYADTSRQFGGTGLGLTITKALVEQMGGTLTVQSELGKGSTFAVRITLPRAKAPELPAAPQSTTTERTALQGKRLLLVEDNEVNRLVARMLLEEWGVVLDEAEDGRAGIQMAAQYSYDAVLMDIQMPGMSGLEATTAIRALPDAARAGVPIIALTANAFEADAQQYLAAGMNACVAKPFDEDLLYNTLVSVLPGNR